jgi:hypothetical protein
MGKLKSQHILQANATILAGLMILLTVQTVTIPPQALTILEDGQKQLAEDKVEFLTYATLVNKLKEKLEEIGPEDEERRKFIQKQIDETETKYFENSIRYDKRNTVMTEEMQGKPLTNHSWSNGQFVQFYAILMMIPFVASIISETISSVGKKDDVGEFASTIGRICMIIGFFALVFGLFEINRINTT